jgi:hypothetical protein
MLEREATALADALAAIRHINDRYVIAARLDAQEQRDAEEYVQQVDNLNAATRVAIQAYLETIPTRRRASWNISDNVINQPLRPTGWSITQSRNEFQPINPPIDQNTSVHNGLEYVSDNLQPRGGTPDQQNSEGLVQQPDHDVEPGDAKRRKMMLEYQLTQKDIQMARQLEDFQRQGQREREDLLNKIELEKKIIDSDNLTSTQGPLLSSTPVIRTSPSAFPPAEPDASHIPIQQKTTTGSSIRWPKITVERFGGDPRKWRKFDHGVNATISDTNMPDSLKLLSLQDFLVDEIRKKNGSCI